jgi:O-antigen/teichoic acid export membrane protein
MNRLRHAYLKIAPALEPYFTTGHHDDEQGLAASYLARGRRLRRSGQFLVNTPTIVATVDAAVAAAIVVLVVRAAEAATTVAVVAGAVVFLVVWAALFLLQRRALDPLRRTTPRFPTPPDKA